MRRMGTIASGWRIPRADRAARAAQKLNAAPRDGIPQPLAVDELDPDSCADENAVDEVHSSHYVET